MKSFIAIIIAVAHQQFQAMGLAAIKQLGKANCVVFDVKHTYASADVDGSL